MKLLNIKNNIIFILSGIIIFLLIKYINDTNNYQIKASVYIPNENVHYIDNFLAYHISNELLQIKEIKDVITISRNEKLNIYLKFQPFLFNKTKTIEKSERKIKYVLSEFNKKESELKFDEDYDKSYDTFVIFNFENINIVSLKKYINNIYNELLKLRISNKIEIFNNQELALYINTKYSTLKNFKIEYEDILNKIYEFNNKINFDKEFNFSNEYNIKLLNKIGNIEDVKNITLNYLDDNLHTKFKKIFDIEISSKKPYEYTFKENDKDGVIFAIDKKDFLSNFIYNLKLKKFISDFNLSTSKYVQLNMYKTNRFHKIVVVFNGNLSIENLELKQKELDKIFKKYKIKNLLYFVGCDCPKISPRHDFFESNNNKITLLCQKSSYREIIKILKKYNYNYFTYFNKKILIDKISLNELNENIEEIKENKKIYQDLTSNRNEIIYNYDNDNLSKNKITYLETTNSILAKARGILAGCFFNNNEKINIIIKNNDSINDVLIYSKKYNALVNLDSVSNTNYNSELYSVARKNGKFISKIIYL